MNFLVKNQYDGKQYPAKGQYWPEHGWHIQVMDLSPEVWGRATNGVGAGPVIDQGFQKELESRGWIIPNETEGSDFNARDYVLNQKQSPKNIKNELLQKLAKQFTQPAQEALDPTVPRQRVKIPPPHFCECGDPGCPVCQGKCYKPARTTVYRSDMKDETGTPMCQGCADDCLDSGIFYTKESAGHIVMDLLINEWGEAPNSPFDAIKLAPAIRYEFRRLGDYEKAKETVLANIADNPNHYATLRQTEALKPKADVKNVSDWEKKAGRKVEREHTSDPATAEVIRSHHHAERKDYYATAKKAGLTPELKGPPPKASFYPSMGGPSSL